MLDWKVMDRGEALPPEPEPQARRAWRVPWRWLLLAGLLLAGAAALAVGQARTREAQLRDDLQRVVEQEARAQAFAQLERATEFADPGASSGWFGRYVDLFRTPRPLPAAPVIRDVTLTRGRVIAEVAWVAGGETIVERRAYRWTDEAWRRTPLADVATALPQREVRSHYFALRGGAADVAALTDDPDLRLGLEGLRGRIVTYWPEPWEDFFLIVQVRPRELSPPVYFSDAQKLYVNRPVLAVLDPTSPLPASAQYRLAVTTSVIHWLTTPDWLRDPATGSASAPLVATDAAARDWAALLRVLQAAEARHWALDGAQRRDLRNSWRAELAGAWPDPFEGPLPLDPATATPDERRRWLVVNLVIERQIAAGGVGTAGRLAHALSGYDPHGFRHTTFLQALIGGSIQDLQYVAGHYVLTMEP